MRGQEHEPVRLEEPSHDGQQRPEIRPDPPRAATGTVPVGRRVEDDPGIAAAASDLALGERDGIVHDPADRPIAQPGPVGVGARPRDGRPRRVDVGHGGPRRGHGQGREARVREQVEDGGCVTAVRDPGGDPLAQPRQHRGVLREEPDLARLGRAQLEGQAPDLDRPRPGGDPGPAPPPIAFEAQVCRRPRRGIAAVAQGRGRRPVDETLPEPLQPGPAAGVDELVAAPAHGDGAGGSRR